MPTCRLNLKGVSTMPDMMRGRGNGNLGDGGENLVKRLNRPAAKVNQLLVLGNGFDLECGLQSTYSDFFTKREEYFKSAVENFVCNRGDVEKIVDTVRINGLSRDGENSVQSRKDIDDLWDTYDKHKLNPSPQLEKRLRDSIWNFVNPAKLNSDRRLFYKFMVDAYKDAQNSQSFQKSQGLQFSPTIWDMLLKNEDKLWIDVEESILYWLIPDQDYKDGEKISRVMRLHKGSIFSSHEDRSEEEKAVRDYIRYLFPGVIDLSNEVLSDLLYKQLETLEKDFFVSE